MTKMILPNTVHYGTTIEIFHENSVAVSYWQISNMAAKRSCPKKPFTWNTIVSVSGEVKYRLRMVVSISSPANATSDKGFYSSLV